MRIRPRRNVRDLVFLALALAAMTDAGPALSSEAPAPVRPSPRPRPPRHPSNGPVVPATCEGHWSGVAHGSDGVPWTIEMDVGPDGAQCGSIEYPSLGCGGELQSCQSAGGRAHYVESYTHNPGTCAPEGVIDAVCSGDAMRWTWTGIEVVHTTLRRR